MQIVHPPILSIFHVRLSRPRVPEFKEFLCKLGYYQSATNNYNCDGSISSTYSIDSSNILYHPWSVQIFDMLTHSMVTFTYRGSDRKPTYLTLVSLFDILTFRGFMVQNKSFPSPTTNPAFQTLFDSRDQCEQRMLILMFELREQFAKLHQIHEDILITPLHDDDDHKKY